MKNYQDDFDKLVNEESPKSISYTLMKLIDPTQGGTKKDSKQDMKFVEESDLKAREKNMKTQ